MHDPHRPAYHLTALRHWINDPIPFYGQGAYHLFYQHNPGASVWGDMHWGHAVSSDLAHWGHLPVALAPSPGGPDADGVFTGCVVEDKGTFYALYTGIPVLEPLQQVQCLASSQDLITWDKYPGNPLIADLPAGFGPCFRDPHVWREGRVWRMLIGGEQRDRNGGTAFLYESADLIAWNYLNPLVLCNTETTGHECECPDLFPLGGEYVFLSSSGQTWWQTGTYDGRTFTPKHIGAVDTAAFYAAKTLRDHTGRRLLFGWLREARSEPEQVAAGWSGVLSLPRVLSLRSDGTLRQDPPGELTALRKRHMRFENVTVPNGVFVLPGVQGDCLEVLITMTADQSAHLGLVVRCDSKGANGVEFFAEECEGEENTLHLFLDRSVFEAFSGGQCETRRFYSPSPDFCHVAISAHADNVRAIRVDVWELGG